MREFMVFLLGAAIAIACLVLLLPSLHLPAGRGILAEQKQLPCNTPAPAVGGVDELGMPQRQASSSLEEDDDLRRVLRSAAMEVGNNIVLMTFANKAWVAPGSLMDLFLESFHNGDNTEPLLKHLVIVAVDSTAFRRCQEVHKLCYQLAGANFTTEQAYLSTSYLDMMWVRNKFQTRVLELGHAFVFTDMDIVWFRNPLLRLPVGADIAISSDQFYGEDPYDVWKNSNGGFLYATPSARTVAFFKGWYEARTAHPGQHDQYVFDRVKYELSQRHGVVVQFVDTAYLGGFCQSNHKDYRLLCTFHANCIKGLDSKLHALRDLLDQWKQFRITGRQGENSNGTAESERT